MCSWVKNLELYLFRWRFVAPDIWPVEDLADKELVEFIDDLYQLCKECLCMRLRVNVAPLVIGLEADENGLGRTKMIGVTRRLLFCCDTSLIEEYRELTLRECDVIRLLEQIHAALIGAHFRTHPFESTVSMRGIRLR